MTNAENIGPITEASTLVEVLRERALQQPERLVYTFLENGEREESQLTYAELDRRARAIAAWLQARDGTGQRALLLYPPGLDFIAAFWGCLYAGAAAVPAYPPKLNRNLSRLQAIVADADASIVLTTERILNRLDSLAAGAEPLRKLRWVATEQVTDEMAGSWQPAAIIPDTLAFLQYTSGSTGTPKGVMLTHRNLLHNQEMIRLAFRQTEGSVIVGWLPLYHDMGLIGNVLQPLYVGARCVLMAPMAFLQKPLRWLQAISRYRATTSGGPNFAYQLCVRDAHPDGLAELDLSSWSAAFNGAEPIRAETLEDFATTFEPCGFRRSAFYPCYGLAEATLFVSGGPTSREPVIRRIRDRELEMNHAEEAAADAEDARALVGCGRAFPDQKIAIVDTGLLRRCPDDEIGEIWVSGPSIAGGYWGQLDETTRTFQAYLEDGGEGPFLRTGDLGFIHDGELFVTGRLKDLIIIRGRNLYPHDIEHTVETSHSGLRHGCGAAFSVESEDGERLVIAQEVENRRESDFDAIMSAIRAAVVEDFEVQPTAIVLLKPGSAPKTSSGKIQRSACRKLFRDGELSALAEWHADADCAFGPVGAEPVKMEATTEAIETWLRSRLAAKLHIDPSSIDSDRPLSDFGLDSLAAVELAHQIENRLGVRMQMVNFLEGRNLSQLIIELSRQTVEAADEGGTHAREDEREFPLSYGQHALWFIQQMAPENSAYNLARALRLCGTLDLTALRGAFEKLVSRHPALRTTFRVSHGEPAQYVHERMEVEFVQVNVRSWTDAEMDAYLIEQAHQPFKLDEGPLLRVTLLERSNNEYVLLLVVHHIAVDYWSLALLWDELGALYISGLGDQAPELALPRRQFADYVRWQRQLLESAEGERLRAYWRKQLDGELRALDLPTDRPRPALQTFHGASHAFKLNEKLTRSLKELAQDHHATLYVTLLAAFQTLLYRYTGQDDMLIGSPATGRNSAAFSRAMGYFVNPIVLRGDLSGNPTFEELLGRVRRTVLDALAHQDYPFALLVRQLQPERDTRRPTLVQTMFVLQKTFLLEDQDLSWFALGEAGGRMQLGEVRCESLALERRSAQFDLTLSMAECGNELAGSFEYSLDLFDKATIERMAANFQILLEGFCAPPATPAAISSRRISNLPLVSASEQKQLLVEWNNTGIDYDSTVNLVQIIERQVERGPEALAISSSGEGLSYRELNARANRLAHRLLELVEGPEAPIGIFIEHSPEMMVALLGALKTGSAYVPFDTSYPRERLRFMAENAGIKVLITQERLLDKLPETRAEVLCLERLRESRDEQHSRNPSVKISAHNPAYIIYTSGSTGQPKGVAIEHHSLLNLVRWHQQVFSVSPTDRATLLASFAFDAAVWEVWPYLATGASLQVVPGELKASPAALGRWLAEREISVSFMPTPLAESWLGLGEAPGGALRLLLVGGDKLRKGWPRGWPRNGCVMVNNYGPTESTVVATSFKLECENDPYGVAPPIGQPIANTQTYILNEAGEPAPAGVIGELHIGGVGLARGYVDRPALTAEKFIPNRFSGEPGARLYRTGDLARYRPDGNIEYVGRKDYQVKVRGNRIELSEVEAALAAHASVRACVVTAQEGTAGALRLLAYLVAENGTALSIGELRDFLGRRLPEYMIPATFVSLAELPVTPNGKVDRKSLPAPDPARSEFNDQAFTAPRTQIEEIICGIWEQALGVERVGLNDNFFELGGHSLVASQVLSRVGKTLHLDLPVRSLFECQTVEAFSAYVAEAIGVGVEVNPLPFDQASDEDRSHLSFSQRRLWFLDQMGIGRAAYNVPVAARISGHLDVAAISHSVCEIIRRHEVLRTSFRSTNSGPVQLISPEMACPVALVDLRELGASARRLEADHLVRQEAELPFNLAEPPLLRARLLRLEDGEHILLLTMHHIASDGWSLGLLTRELTALYEARLKGLPSPLEPLRIQYADFASWQRRRLTGTRLEEQLAYWKRQLSGQLPLLALPADLPRPPVQTFRGATLQFQLPEQLGERLAGLSRRHDATLFMTLLAAFHALLCRYTGQTDILVGTPVANRARPEVEGLIGCFVNTLVLRSDLSGNPTFTDLLGRVREVTLEAYAHQDLPFETLVEELQPERSLSHATLFGVMFVLQNAPPPSLNLTGLRVQPLRVENGTAKLDLTLSIGEAGGRLEGTIEYNTDLFHRATIERMIGHFVQILEGVVAHPGQRLSELPLLTNAEQYRLLSEWAHEGSRLVPNECGIHEMFEAQEKRAPDAIALVCAEQRLTYRELNRRANQLALFLRHLAIGPETMVGVSLDRSVEMIVALLGVLKAGGAYVPLDPAYPVERLRFMLEDSRAAILLTRRCFKDKLAAHHARIICLDTDWKKIADQTEDDPSGVLAPGNLAYLIYTSGSTGRPKGVAIAHHNAVVMIHWARDIFTDAELEGVLASTSICFDLSVFEIFVPLSWGGKVVLAANALELPEAAAAEEVTLINTVPSAMTELLRLGGAPNSVKTINLAGEPLQNPLVQQIYRQEAAGRVLNLYGPSEDTTYSTWAPVEAGRTRPVTIGRPINNTQVYLLDPNGRPVPEGVTGELYLGGAGLARGYLYRPDLTAERFVPNPFSNESSTRLYRTGDLARYLHGGEIEFLGRADYQIKIRGFRIELREIEELMLQHPSVQEAVVIARNGEELSHKQLVCYVIAGATPPPSPNELRGYLREKAPEYMVPACFVLLDELPLTPNGKVDRRALPAPRQTATSREASYLAPRTETESALAEMWAALLDRRQVGIRDGFFDLGGHSLLATQVVSRVRETFGVELPLRSIFETPTIAELAKRIEISRPRAESAKLREGVEMIRPAGSEPVAPPISPAPRDGELPLSYAQQRLRFLDLLTPGNPIYNVLGGMHMKGELEIHTLKKALDEIVRRHEALRTTFDAIDGHPVQVISPPQAVDLPVVDLIRLPESERESAVRAFADEELRRPFELTSGPLLRITLLRLSENEHVILVAMHHIISDGWSIGIFIDEAIALYLAFRDGRPSPLAELPVQYADFARWQREWFRGEALETHLTYWRQKLGGALPMLELPLDRPAPDTPTFQGANFYCEFAPELHSALLDLSRRNGVTLYMTMLAAFQILLHRYTRQEDIIVGTAVAGRNRVEIEKLIGVFINMLVIRCDLSGNPSFRELLGRVREETLAAYAHQDAPFEKLVEELQPQRTLSRTPLFQAAFGLQAAPKRTLDLSGLQLRYLSFASHLTRYDLTLWILEGEDGLSASWTFSADLFERSTIELMQSRFETLLRSVVEEPDGHLSALEIHTEEERRQLAVRNKEISDVMKMRSAMRRRPGSQPQNIF